MPEHLAEFWAELAPPGPTQVPLRFVPGDPPGDTGNREHLHLTGAADEDQERTVAQALALGATHLDLGRRPEEPHVVLADPDGYAFCVIPFGNTFLEGCGPLGEVSCDGTREVGVFWAAVLDWPLVWDRNGETAVQHPDGGTKVSWGGPPVRPVRLPARQWFELEVTSGSFQQERARLLALGATPGEEPGVLHDVDGNPFRLLR